LDIFKCKGLKTFIYFSTQQVLGKLTTSIIDENAQAYPLNHYGLTHLLGEQIVSYFNRISDISCINIRLSNSFGPPIFKENNCWWLVVNDLSKTAYEKGKIVLLSDGTPQRDFIHIKDIGLAVKTILETKNISPNIINLGSGKTYTILELAHLVKTVYKSLYFTEIDIVLDDGSISKELSKSLENKFLWKTDELQNMGFSPKMNLEQGIYSMFKYLEKNKTALK
jgi:UDP-glucose 4-epimerase